MRRIGRGVAGCRSGGFSRRNRQACAHFDPERGRPAVRPRPGRRSASVRTSTRSRGGSSSAARAPKTLSSIHQLGATVVHVQGSVENAIAELESNPAVAYAEPNWIYHADAVPNDPSYLQDYGLAKIQAPQAWDVTTGSAAVTVAVVDTGIATDHPDLSGNVVPGYDFVQDDTDPRDFNGHGTHVAGTIGAKGNNGIGVAGVNWNVQLMPVRVLDGDGSGSSSDITNGFLYACTPRGARRQRQPGRRRLLHAHEERDRLAGVREHALRARRRQQRHQQRQLPALPVQLRRAAGQPAERDLHRRQRPDRHAGELLELRREQRRPGRSRRRRDEHLARVRHALLAGVRGSVPGLDAHRRIRPLARPRERRVQHVRLARRQLPAGASRTRARPRR